MTDVIDYVRRSTLNIIILNTADKRKGVIIPCSQHAKLNFNPSPISHQVFNPSKLKHDK